MRWANGSLYGPNNIFVYSQGDRYYGQWHKDHQEGNNAESNNIPVRDTIKVKISTISTPSTIQ